MQHLSLRRRAAFLLGALVSLTAASNVYAQPSFDKTFTPSTIGPGSVSTVRFTITNLSGVPVTDMAFTDALPLAVTIADPANASTTCDLVTTGALDAPAGGGTIMLSGAQVPGSQTCFVTVDVTASTVGMHTNPAITLTTSAGSSMSTATDLTVATDRPGFSKSFSPSSISLGGRSTLTLTVDNSANVSDLSSLVITDNFPLGLEIADPANASTTCAGPNPQFTAVAGTSLVAFQSFGILFPGFEVMLAGETCTIIVDVTATGRGVLDNVTEELTTNAGSSGRASDSLEVTVTRLALEKAFIDDPVPPGDTAQLEFTISNFDRDFTATGMGFTDDLGAALAGLELTSVLANDCGGMISGLATTVMTFSGGMLAPQASCTIRVSVTVPPGAVPGSYTNTTGAISATIDGVLDTGNMASDDLFVEPIPLLTKTYLDSPVNPGDSTRVEFTITNTSTTSSATDIFFEDLFPTITPTASVTPGNDCCGAGSTCTFSPLFNPPPPSDVIPATLTISGGTLAPADMSGDSCTFVITLDVEISAAAGLYTNTTSEITATVDGATRTGAPATDDLIVASAPSLAKVFTDDPVVPGDTVTLEFTLTHPPDAATDATGITFTDDLSFLAGLTATVPPSPDPPCGAGSTLTASAGNTLLTFMGGTLMPGEACTFSVTLNVPAGAAAGTFTNVTSGVAATVDGFATTSAPASDDLVVTGLMTTMEFIGDPVIPGDTVTLRFTLENISATDDATSISFSNDLAFLLPGVPDVALFTSLPLSACGGTLSNLGLFLIYSGGSLMQGDPPCSFDITLLVPAGADDGTFTNTTSNVTALIGGSLVVLSSFSDGLEVNSTLLSLTKEFTDDPVAPGDSVNLRFTLLNLDPTEAISAIEFTDSLDAALTGLVATGLPLAACGGTLEANPDAGNLSFSGGSLTAGEECSFDVSLDVPLSATPNIYTNTTSDITGTLSGFPVSGDAASANLTLLNLLDFSKSFDGPTTATGTATLTFTITNPGADNVNSLAFSDDLDAVLSGLVATNLPLSDVCGAGSLLSGTSFVTLSGGSLPPLGGMCTFDVEVAVPAGATPGDFLNTTSDLLQAGLTVSPPATATLTIEPAPEFSKSFAPNPVLPSEVSTLTFTIDNTSSALAATGLDFTDNLPFGVVINTPSNAATTCGGTLTAVAGTSVVTLTGGSVAAASTCTVQVDVIAPLDGSFPNTSGDLTSSSGNSGTASDTLVVNPAVDLSITKTDGVTSAIAGTSVTYTIVVTNAGPSTDPSVTVSDTFPSPPLTCTYTSSTTGGATGNTAAGSGDLAETLSMPIGSVVTYTVTCDIDSDATGTLSNTATVTASVTELDGSDNSATDDDTMLVAEADLSVTKTDGVTAAIPGQTVLTYTIVAANAGPSDDPSVSLTDTLPSTLDCTFTSVAAGGATGNTAAGMGDLAETLSLPASSSITYTVTCNIDSDATGTLSNTATVSGSVTDPDSGNNSATDDDTVLTPQVDLSVTKSDGVVAAVPGQSLLTYTIVVANAGPSDDPAATLSDVLPSDLDCTYTSVTAGGASGNTAAGSGDLAESLSLPSGSSVTYTLTCTIDDAATGTLSNTATVSASVTDVDGGNNSATDDDTELMPAADTFVMKSGPSSATVGDTLTFTLTVNNDGPSTAPSVTLDDPTPAGLTFISATAPCAAGFPCDLGDIMPGVETIITVEFELPFTYAGADPIVNTASVANDVDMTPGNDTSTVETTVTFDDTPPTVTEVATVDGPLAVCDTVRSPITRIDVTFEDNLSPLVGADDSANYLLLQSGPDGDFSTTACGGAAGDDVAVAISSVALSGTTPITIAGINFPGLGLDEGLYRLLVCDTITDAPGNALDGDGDSAPGIDFVVSFFRADPGNLFVNGHFDDCPVTLDPWVTMTTPPNTVIEGIAGTDDVDGSPLSASAAISQTLPDVSAIAQCVDVTGGLVYDLTAWVSFTSPLGALGIFENACEFFDGTNCGGSSLGEQASTTLLEDEGGAWIPVSRQVSPPASSASALCRFRVEGFASNPVFEVRADALTLATEGTAADIFADGFESGDTTAWSSATP